MASPKSTPATLRPEIAGTLEEFSLEAEEAGFIGLKLMPVFEASKQSGIFGKIEIEDLLVERDTGRAPGAAYTRSGMKFTDDSYATAENGFEEPVDHREAELYSDFFDAETMAARRARATIQRSQEQRVVTKILASSNTTGATAVWDGASGVPVDDIEAAVQTVYDRTGIWPNMLAISKKTFRKLRNNVQVIDRIKYAGIMDPAQRSINVAALEQLFDISISVSGVTRNTGKEGAGPTLASSWDPTKAAVLVTPRSGDIREPCYGRTFHWGEDGSQIGGLIESYEETQNRSTIIRARNDTDEKELLAGMVQVITSVNA